MVSNDDFLGIMEFLSRDIRQFMGIESDTG
jgi:hypothetical protein